MNIRYINYEVNSMSISIQSSLLSLISQLQSMDGKGGGISAGAKDVMQHLLQKIKGMIDDGIEPHEIRDLLMHVEKLGDILEEINPDSLKKLNKVKKNLKALLQMLEQIGNLGGKQMDGQQRFSTKSSVAAIKDMVDEFKSNRMVNRDSIKDFSELATTLDSLDDNDFKGLQEALMPFEIKKQTETGPLYKSNELKTIDNIAGLSNTTPYQANYQQNPYANLNNTLPNTSISKNPTVSIQQDMAEELFGIILDNVENVI